MCPNTVYRYSDTSAALDVAHYDSDVSLLSSVFPVFSTLSHIRKLQASN